jgi:hypothetical protein
MHGETNIKFISAQQARSIYNFRKKKEKKKEKSRSNIGSKMNVVFEPPEDGLI